MKRRQTLRHSACGRLHFGSGDYDLLERTARRFVHNQGMKGAQIGDGPWHCEAQLSGLAKLMHIRQQVVCLATLVKAIYNAWPRHEDGGDTPVAA